MTPPALWPRRRADQESVWSRSAVVLPSAWTLPTRRLPPRSSAQSESPAEAVGTAARIPAATSRSAASSPCLPPTRSRRSALVQAPITTSVKGGCSGCPSQVPLRRSLSTDSCGTALRTACCSGSASASSGSICSIRSAIVSRARGFMRLRRSAPTIFQGSSGLTSQRLPVPGRPAATPATGRATGGEHGPEVAQSDVVVLRWVVLEQNDSPPFPLALMRNVLSNVRIAGRSETAFQLVPYDL